MLTTWTEGVNLLTAPSTHYPINLLNVFVASIFHSLFDYVLIVSFVDDNPNVVSFGVDGVELLALRNQPLSSNLLIVGEKIKAKGSISVHCICEDVMEYIFLEKLVTGF